MNKKFILEAYLNIKNAISQRDALQFSILKLITSSKNHHFSTSNDEIRGALLFKNRLTLTVSKSSINVQ
jgi:hypothetical protein